MSGFRNNDSAAAADGGADQATRSPIPVPASPSAHSSFSAASTSPTTPFTRNQDAYELTRRMHRSSLSNSSSGGFNDGAIDEEDEDSEAEEARAAQFRPFPSIMSPASPRGPITGKDSSQLPGLPMPTSVKPAGADHQNPVLDHQLPTSEAEYARPVMGRRSSITHEGVQARARGIVRTYSMSQQKRRPQMMNNDTIMRTRRLSHDATQEAPRRFIVDVEETMRLVLEQEDTDGNFQINITDGGPKVMSLGTAESNGYKGVDIRGTYMLSNLLQELALAKQHGRKRIVLDESRLTENPVDRLSRMISQTFWHNLTRRIDRDGLAAILLDPKNRSKSKNPRIYVPDGEPAMLEYYQAMAKEKAELHLEVLSLPALSKITPEYVRDLNEKPGLLALAMREQEGELRGIPFIVPGARFNELYNWDSYFISLGLVVDNMVEMAQGIVDHFVFEIKHYGKILNGNRTYYLLRAQPPFLTDMALQVYSRLDPANAEANKAWLKTAIQAAIKEYHTVWMSQPRYDPKTGLSRYRPEGLGVPPETEASHFTHVLKPFAEKHGLSVNEFTRKYNYGKIKEPELDEYFLHDRAVRESGHDTSYRLEKVCANLATIDLNSLLYKYEVDIATAIRELFDDHLTLDDDFLLHGPLPPNYAQKGAVHTGPSRSIETPQTSAEWFARAVYRKQQVDTHLWNEGMGLYYDYDTVAEEQICYETVTAYWAMWAGMASEEQAEKLVRQSLKKFEVVGGLVPGTEESRGKITLDRPNRQWDFPYAWPPHQILAWVGLERYGYLEDARRLAYRWLYMMTVSFVDFNGVVAEKFDAVKLSHMVNAEYGNQGTDFKFVPTEGFGWTNASYQVGLTFLTTHMRRAVAACQHPDDFFSKSQRH